MNNLLTPSHPHHNNNEGCRKEIGAMTTKSSYTPERRELEVSGFAIMEDIYSTMELNEIASIIQAGETSKPNFKRSAEVFAIRRLLKEIPELKKILFNDKLISLVKGLMGEDYFLVKSIYFDKPEKSNWFVAYHQDLTISVNKKMEIAGYGPWTVKQEQFAVQPPMDLLKKIYTIRIHLDDANEKNGALKVIPGSHAKGIYRPESINWLIEKETICEVKRGGLMLMRPLLLHSSGRSTGQLQRRVIHLEFSNLALADGLEWAEKEFI